MLWIVAFVTILVSPALAGEASSDDFTRPSNRDIYEQPDPYSVNDFGGVGLLQTRTARFAPDGFVQTGANWANPFRQYFLTWQVTPWLETTFRYADIRGNNDLDRSLDIKLRLWEESDFWPAFAFGIQDGLGSGRFGSEYLVASKRYYDFDFSLGLAWGYLGSRGHISNLFKHLSSSFASRDANQGEGGKIAFGNFLSGKTMGFFGGVEYHTPVRGLTVKAEYNGGNPETLGFGDTVKDQFPVNIGLNYRPFSWVDLSLGFERGNTVMAGLTFRANMHQLVMPKSDPPPPPVKARPKALAHPGGKVESERKPPPPADHTNNDQPNLAKLTGLLYDAGIVAPELIYRHDHLVLKADIAQDTCDKTGLKAAAVLFAKLPRRYDRIEVRSRADAGTACLKYIARNDTVDVPLTNGKAAETESTPDRIHAVQKSTRYMPLFGNVPWQDIQITQDTKKEKPPAPPEVVRKQALPIFKALKAEKIRPLGLEMTAKSATVHVEAEKFAKAPVNAGRTARVMANHLPPDVEELTIAQERLGVETSRLTIYRSDLEDALVYKGSPEEIWLNASLQAPKAHPFAAPGYYASAKAYPHFSWDILPVIKQHLGNGDNGGYRAEVFATLRGQVDLFHGLTLTGDLTQDIAGNLDRVPPRSGTDVPHVRSDIARYTREGRTAITRLAADYLFSPAQNWYMRASAGIFETMYGGASGEVLYRPYGENWAVGANVNWLRKRDYDQLFDFKSYSVVTGQASLYYELPRYGLRGVFSAGRYLAGDYGATFDLSRQFGNGIRLGVWATVTDMSSTNFGAGSFDKGIYLTIPFDVFWHSSSRRSLELRGSDLGRDGGQRLRYPVRLYDVLEEGRAAAFEYGWRYLLK